MFSWITGSRPGYSDNNGAGTVTAEDTFIDAPETPAPVFAVRAFKHAIFGTPRPPSPDKNRTPAGTSAKLNIVASEKPKKSLSLKRPTKSSDKVGDNETANVNKKLAQTVDTTPQDFQQPDLETAPISPVKQAGILMTPGTTNGKRKQVTFGEQVVDNEGKRSKYSNSGLPDNYPGKFPSPWTPKTVDIVQEKKPRETSDRKLYGLLHNKSTKGLESSKSSKTPAQPSSVHSKDDNDITVDLNLPKSSSGRYWKEQYESYSSQSEIETRRLIAKHKLAKEYARRKDEQAMALKEELEKEKKKRLKREKILDAQIKDLRERLRQEMAENAKHCVEITALKMSLEGGERGKTIEGATQRIKTAKSVEAHLALTGPSASPIHTKHEEERDVWLESDVEDDLRTRHRRLRVADRMEHRSKSTRTKDRSRSQIAQDATSTVSTPARNGHSTQKSPAQVSPLPATAQCFVHTPLGNHSLNITATSKPNTTKKVSSNEDKVTISTHHGPSGLPKSIPSITHASIYQISDITAPLEELSLQASQPITPLSERRRATGSNPSSSSSSRRTAPRPIAVGAKKMDISRERLAKAKERIEARKRSKDAMT